MKWFGNCNHSVGNRNIPCCPVRPPESCFIIFGDKDRRRVFASDWLMSSAVSLPKRKRLPRAVDLKHFFYKTGPWCIQYDYNMGNKYQERWFQRMLYLTMNIPTSTYFLMLLFRWFQILWFLCFFWKGNAALTLPNFLWVLGYSTIYTGVNSEK